jgi:hypothetical protein
MKEGKKKEKDLLKSLLSVCLFIIFIPLQPHQMTINTKCVSAIKLLSPFDTLILAV